MKGVYPHPTKHRRYKGETWWRIDLGRKENGIKKWKSFQGTFEEACKWRGRFLASLKKKVGAISHEPTIKELIVPFKNWYKSEAAPRTVKDIQFSIDIYFLPWFGGLRVEQLTVQTFNNFKDDLLHKGLSPTTINKHLNYLSSILRWAEDHGHIKTIPKIPRFPKKKTQPKEETRPLTKRQARAIYNHIEPEYKILFLLMVDMGLRQEEALNIKIDDIDEDAETITVIGKGSKKRIIPFMSDRFEEELEKVLDKPPGQEGYLVTNPKTGKPYATIWKALKRAAEKAEITKKINHHILRHTFATNCAKQGYSPYVTQKLLGHASIETTMKIYTHLGLDFVGNEVRRMRGKIE